MRGGRGGAASSRPEPDEGQSRYERLEAAMSVPGYYLSDAHVRTVIAELREALQNDVYSKKRLFILNPEWHLRPRPFHHPLFVHTPRSRKPSTPEKRYRLTEILHDAELRSQATGSTSNTPAGSEIVSPRVLKPCIGSRDSSIERLGRRRLRFSQPERSSRPRERNDYVISTSPRVPQPSEQTAYSLRATPWLFTSLCLDRKISAPS